MKRHDGFSLTEIMVTLGVLGILAALMMPSLLNISNTDKKRIAVTKEAASMVQAAYANYRQTGKVNADTHLTDFTSYMKLVEYRTTGTIDEVYGVSGTKNCDDWTPCLQLANGAAIQYYKGWGGAGSGIYFGGTSNTHFILFGVDPDGKFSSTSATNSDKKVDFALFYDGRVSLFADCKSGSLVGYDGSNASWCPGGGKPPWFQW